MTLKGNAAGNRIELGSGGGSAFGLAGDDVLVAGRGHALLDGGAGDDTAIISYTNASGSTGPQIGFTLDGDVVITTSDNVTRLHDVETVNISLPDGGTRLYTANLQDIDEQYAAFGGRHANASELGVWSRLIAGGASIDDVKTAILNDPLGKAYINGQITQAYRTYAGRAPNASELQVWGANLQKNGFDFAILKEAILSEPLGTAYLNRQITETYRTYAGRAPSGSEVQVWRGVVQSNGFEFDVVKRAILSEPLGQGYIRTQIAQSYQTYAGRPPIEDELRAWDANLRRNGFDFDTIKLAIFNEQLGTSFIDGQITASYRTYAGRDPVDSELQVWKELLNGDGFDFDQIKAAILDDPLRRNHTADVLTSLYGSYAGRAPSASEIAAAHTLLQEGGDYAALRAAFFADASVRDYEVEQIGEIYETYAGRAASAAEVAVWDANLKSGDSFDTIRRAILSEPLRKAYVDERIAEAYQEYAGRAPRVAEVQAWENNLKANGLDFDLIRTAILTDPLGKSYVVGQITEAYVTYAGRAPTSAELRVWEGNLRTNGFDFDVVKNAILHDPLGEPYIDAQITQAYLTYAGRAPIGNEVDIWEGYVRDNDYDFGIVQAAIMDDPLGDVYATAQIESLFQRYFLRSASASEQMEWHERLGSDSYDTLRATLLNDPQSSATKQMLSGTAGADTFVIDKAANNVVINGFDPDLDKISLQGSAFGARDPLDYAREVDIGGGAYGVLISPDPMHDLLLPNVMLNQLSASDFLF